MNRWWIRRSRSIIKTGGTYDFSNQPTISRCFDADFRLNSCSKISPMNRHMKQIPNILRVSVSVDRWQRQVAFSEFQFSLEFFPLKWLTNKSITSLPKNCFEKFNFKRFVNCDSKTFASVAKNFTFVTDNSNLIYSSIVFESNVIIIWKKKCCFCTQKKPKINT